MDNLLKFKYSNTFFKDNFPFSLVIKYAVIIPIKYGPILVQGG